MGEDAWRRPGRLGKRRDECGGDIKRATSTQASTASFFPAPLPTCLCVASLAPLSSDLLEIELCCLLSFSFYRHSAPAWPPPISRRRFQPSPCARARLELSAQPQPQYCARGHDSVSASKLCACSGTWLSFGRGHALLFSVPLTGYVSLIYGAPPVDPRPSCLTREYQ
jgi:hypothetical protein